MRKRMLFIFTNKIRGNPMANKLHWHSTIIQQKIAFHMLLYLLRILISKKLKIIQVNNARNPAKHFFALEKY